MGTRSTTVVVIGGGVVGAAMLYTLAHRGVDAVLLESDDDLAYSASGTNSGVLHTGFDSTPGQLETDLILRAGRLRPAVLAALDVPVEHCGAVLPPRSEDDLATIDALEQGARANGVRVQRRDSDGALLVPGESVTDPVAFTQAMAGAAVAAGAGLELDARVDAIETTTDGLRVHLADGRIFRCAVAINCAGLHADDVARLVGDDSFEIYPRKGEFFVFELPGGERLDHIVLPVPTKRTKGVLVFPTLDGKVVAGPTAVDLEDKDDWSVRPEAQDEVLATAVRQLPALDGLTPIASYAGLRPAGRGVNYVVGPAATCPALVNVAAIRSTGLSASLGLAGHVSEMLPDLGVTLGQERMPEAAVAARTESGRLWWQRTAGRHCPATTTPHTRSAGSS